MSDPSGGHYGLLFSGKPTEQRVSQPGPGLKRPSPVPQVHDSDMLMCEMHKSGSEIVAFCPLSFPMSRRRGRLGVACCWWERGAGWAVQTDRSLSTSLVWRLHRVWRECLTSLDWPPGGRGAGGSGKVEEGVEEASLGLTGNLNGVETGQGATRQIHLKPRPTQSGG